MSRAFCVRSYGRYLVVAAVVGLITVGVREALGAVLPRMSGQYAWTMVFSYGVGVVLSYFAQAHLTFGTAGHSPSRAGMAGFAALAVLSALLTAQTAYVLRYGLLLEVQLPLLAAPLAFAVAALLIAPVTFLLGRQLVFGKPARPAVIVRDPWWAWLMLVTLVIGHSAMLAQVVLRYNANAGHDEALFMRLAQSLAAGDWLGTYSVMTLVKGSGFPVWLAAAHILQVPVSCAAALTYALSCVLVFLALRPLVPSAWQRLLIFLALLLSPFAFSEFAVMRELIYASLSLMVVACGVGLALRIEQLTQRIAPWWWAAGLGLASALFALTREESIWLLPLWLGVTLRATWMVRFGKAKGSVLLATATLTGLMGALPVLVMASQNRHHYGVFTVLEVNNEPFVSAYGALVRVGPRETAPQVPVSREAWGRVAAVSPAFAEVSNHLQGDIGNAWVRATPSVTRVGALMDVDPHFRHKVIALLRAPMVQSAFRGAELLKYLYRDNPAVRRRIQSYFGGVENAERFFDTENEIGGGWFIWALRDSASAAGHHANAVEARRFYQRLADEVNAACDQRKLLCNAERHSLRPVFYGFQLGPFGASLFEAADFLTSMPGLSTGGDVGTLGEDTKLKSAEAFMNERLAASRMTLPTVEPLESLIVVYRNLIPWMSGIAVVVWLLATPLPRRRLADEQRLLWLLGLLLLTLVLVRLALVALLNVTSWPSIDARYLAAAQPLLVLFDAVGLLLLMASVSHRRGDKVAGTNRLSA